VWSEDDCDSVLGPLDWQGSISSHKSNICSNIHKYRIKGILGRTYMSWLFLHLCSESRRYFSLCILCSVLNSSGDNLGCVSSWKFKFQDVTNTWLFGTSMCRSVVFIQVFLKFKDKIIKYRKTTMQQRVCSKHLCLVKEIIWLNSIQHDGNLICWWHFASKR
jgi:hypothetical protein